MKLKLTTVEWIDAHADHGGNEHLRDGEETMMVCPCGSTHVYSIDTLLDDQQEAVDRAMLIQPEVREAAREVGLRLQEFLSAR